MDLQERINAYWEGLGDKYGFKNMTVEGSAKGQLYFLAEPKPIITEDMKKQKEYSDEIKGLLEIFNAKLKSCDNATDLYQYRCAIYDCIKLTEQFEKGSVKYA